MRFFETYVERSVCESPSTYNLGSSGSNNRIKPTISYRFNDDQTNARKSKILNYQGTPEVLVGVFDSVICAAIPVSIDVTSSVPSAALAHAIAFAFVISA